ncbi:MAG: hypothetical protein N3A59_02770 [Thermodesulfovibrionales bacterium]|nr:hypothetical protein [Thermodesulfovibrionales bacterium]
MKCLYLIDGSSYIYRAYHATKGLTNSKGFPTNAIYVFTNMLLKIIKQKKPDVLAIAFDTAEPTERHILYEKYKAQRPETPQDLLIQIPFIKEIINAFRIKLFETPGYEADDIIGTIAIKSASDEVKVFIVSGDKDMLQLINENIFVYDPIKDVVIDKDMVLKKFGVPPKKIPEVMALAGDSIDNIPGVKGIGEKTATQILREIETIEALPEKLDLIKNLRVRKLIQENIEIIKISKKLATINHSVPLNFTLEEMTPKEPQWETLLKIFSDLEFFSLIKLLPSHVYHLRGEYKAITTKEDLLSFIGKKL